MALGLLWPHETESREIMIRTHVGIDSVALALASGAARSVSWYDFREDGTDPYYNEHHFGLIRQDLTPKIGYPDKWRDYSGLDIEADDLLGLYEGIPLTERSVEDSGVLPDVIYVFRQPHLDMALDREELIFEIETTLVHEIAHYFGIDDDHLDEIGWG